MQTYKCHTAFVSKYNGKRYNVGDVVDEGDYDYFFMAEQELFTVQPKKKHHKVGSDREEAIVHAKAAITDEDMVDFLNDYEPPAAEAEDPSGSDLND